MRGNDYPQSSLFSFVDLESRIPEDHPLRPIRRMVDGILEKLSRDFDRMYSQDGRPSIAPEKLLRAQLLQVLFTIRSERLLVEQLNYNLLFRWFTGLGMDDAIWVATTFTKNRDRLLGEEVAKKFFAEVLQLARKADLLSDEHFTVDGTFLEAWASQKSFKPKDGSGGDDTNQSGRNGSVDFSRQKRSNATHASITDPDARLLRKGGDGAKLVHNGHVMTENRNGLVVAASVTIAGGNAERDAALDLLAKRKSQRPATVGADKGYDDQTFVDEARKMGITPHVAQNTRTKGGSRIDRRTTRQAGYAVSQRRRKMVEEVFGWMKTVGLMRKVRHRGTEMVGWMFAFTAAVYNLVRLRKLLPTAA